MRNDGLRMVGVGGGISEGREANVEVEVGGGWWGMSGLLGGVWN